jgi:hypothetical protein
MVLRRPGMPRVAEEEKPAATRAADPTAAKVRMRIKGNADGPVYQGQTIIRHCGNREGR